MIKIGVEGNNTISTRYPGLGKRFCFAQPRSTFTFYVCTIAFLQGYCVLRLCFTFTFYVPVTFHGVWSWSPGHGYVTHVHVVTITFTVPGPYTLGPWSWLRYIRPRLRLRSWSSLYKPNTTVLRYYICNQKILTMTSTHDNTIEMLNDLYLIVAGTDLSNSKINKTAIFAYLYQQIELQENLAEIEMDYWNSKD